MVTPNQGLSAQDLANRARVPTIRRNGGAPEDALGEALRTSRQIAADTVIRRSVSAAEADARREELEAEKLDLERRRVQAESRALTTQQAAPEAADDGIKEMLFGEINGLRQRLEQMQSTMTDDKIGELNARLNQMSNELMQARQSGPTSLDDVVVQLDAAQKLVERISPRAVVPLSENPSLEAFKLKLQDTREQRQLEAELRREELQGRLAMDRDLREREISLAEKRGADMDRFFTNTGPKAMDLLQSLVDTMRQRQPAMAATAETAPTAGPDFVAPQAVPPVRLAPGVNQMQCGDCGNIIYYREDWRGVICSHCLTEYTFTPVDEPTAEPAPEPVP